MMMMMKTTTMIIQSWLRSCLSILLLFSFFSHLVLADHQTMGQGSSPNLESSTSKPRYRFIYYDSDYADDMAFRQIDSLEMDIQNCDQLPAFVYNCAYNHTCVYGSQIETECTVPSFVECNGNRKVIKRHTCAYCYQLHESNYTCKQSSNCKLYAKYLANCTTHHLVHCLGSRSFLRYRHCDFSNGIRWDYTFLTSIFLGGFGFDRVYLGNWQEGLGKLFSFGGLGVWTLVDIILVWAGYIKPSDGTLYS